MPTVLRVIRLWPEFLLGVFTVLFVLRDGLHSSAGDPGYYYQVSQQIGQGLLPWRDFPFEYPPISLPAVLLPYYLPGGASYESYIRGLFTENVLLLLAIGIGVAWLASRGWSRVSWFRSAVIYGAMALTLAPTVVWRYDAVPTLLTVLAVIAAALHRPVAAGVAMGAAIIGKLYPLAMMPALFIGQIRYGRFRPALLLLGASVVTVALIVTPFVLVAGTGAFSFLQYAIARAVQSESVPGGIALLAEVVGGPEATIYHGFGAWQVDSPLIPLLGTIWTGFTVLAVIALGLAIWHRYRVERVSQGGLVPLTQVTQLLAALMVVLVSARVLSPQYVFWVVPFVALMGRAKTLFFWATCLFTTFVYPIHFPDLLNEETITIWALNIRNAMLVIFTVWVIAPDVIDAVSAIRARLQQRATVPSG